MPTQSTPLGAQPTCPELTRLTAALASLNHKALSKALEPYSHPQAQEGWTFPLATHRIAVRFAELLERKESKEVLLLVRTLSERAPALLKNAFHERVDEKYLVGRLCRTSAVVDALTLSTFRSLVAAGVNFSTMLDDGTSPRVELAHHGRLDLLNEVMAKSVTPLRSSEIAQVTEALHLKIVALFENYDKRNADRVEGQLLRLLNGLKRWDSVHSLFLAETLSTLPPTYDAPLLSTAIRLGIHIDCVSLMLDLGADPKLSSVTELGDDALHTAVRFVRPFSVALLLDRGHPVDRKNARGETPLNILCDHSPSEIRHIGTARLLRILDTLLFYEPSPSAANHRRLTPLNNALATCYSPLASRMLDYADQLSEGTTEFAGVRFDNKKARNEWIQRLRTVVDLFADADVVTDRLKIEARNLFLRSESIKHLIWYFEAFRDFAAGSAKKGSGLSALLPHLHETHREGAINELLGWMEARNDVIHKHYPLKKFDSYDILLNRYKSRVPKQKMSAAGPRALDNQKFYHPGETDLIALLSRKDDPEFKGTRVDVLSRSITSIYQAFLERPVPHRLLHAAALGGVLGNSFPIWKYDTRRAHKNSPCPLEEFGFEPLFSEKKHKTALGSAWKLSDEGKKRVLAIPTFEPETAYILDPETIVVFRHSYLLAYHPEKGCVVWRNSSWTYGRDKLLQPAYYIDPVPASTSPLPLTENIILNLTPDMIERHFHSIFSEEATMDLATYVPRFASLIDILCGVRRSYFRRRCDLSPSAWDETGGNILIGGANSEGFRPFVNHLNDLFEVSNFKSSLGAMPHLALVHEGRFHWERVPFKGPNGKTYQTSLPTTAEVLETLGNLADARYTDRELERTGLRSLLQAGLDAHGAELVLVDPQDF